MEILYKHILFGKSGNLRFRKHNRTPTHQQIDNATKTKQLEHPIHKHIKTEKRDANTERPYIQLKNKNGKIILKIY